MCKQLRRIVDVKAIDRLRSTTTVRPAPAHAAADRTADANYPGRLLGAARDVEREGAQREEAAAEEAAHKQPQACASDPTAPALLR